jgi:hypothetical protein
VTIDSFGKYSCPKDTNEFAPKPAFLMFSASEGEIAHFLKDPIRKRNLQIHNSVHLTRSYPKGTRVGSSNYDPCPAWETGAQVVALNYQTASEPMWLNDAKFTLNQGRGWILKPQWLLDGSGVPSRQSSPIVLKVKVIRGGGFPSTARDIIDPYIEVKVVGWKDDTKRERTKTVSNNGLDPAWNVEFAFPIVAPELDLLCVNLWDADTSGDDIVGHFVVPVVAIREGLHSVPFLDNTRERKRIRGAWTLVDVTLTGR